MKIQIAIATAALALVGSVAANAQIPPSAFTVVVSPTPQTWLGSPLVYGGEITNNTANTLNLSIDSITAPVGVGYTDEFSANVLPISLAPGASYGPVSDLFTITGPVTAAYTGTFSVTDLSNPNFPNGITGYAPYQVILPAATTPEPGGLALLASSAMGGGLFLRRRRK